MSTADRDARQRRSRLIHEMSRNIKLDNLSIASSLKRHDRSFASSTGSKHGSVASSISRHGSSQHGTVSRDSTRSTDFDPERDEALVSTQRIDFDASISQKLPQLRDTARKYGQWQPKKAEDFKINTSAIGRAFPDFTQGDTELSLSIEQPRARLSNTDQFHDASPLATRVNGARLRGSPRAPRPQSPILEALNRKEDRKEDKENIAPRSQKSVGSAYVSQASRTTSINAYQDPADSVNIDDDTLSTMPLPSPLPKEFQAHVESDMSMMDSSFADSSLAPSPSKPNTSQPMAPRPSPLKTTTQAPDSDVFTSTSEKSQASSSFDVGKHTTGKAPALNKGKQVATRKPITHEAPVVKAQQANKPSTTQPTQSSFIITAPTITKKVSATVKPFVQQGRVLTSRSRQRPVDGFKQDHTEENIYDMIDMLQDKVAEQEMIIQSQQETITGFQKDNEQLLSQSMQLKASDTERDNNIKEAQKKDAEQQNIIKEAQKTIKELQKKDVDNQKTIKELKAADTKKQNTIKEVQKKVADYENNTKELRKKAADHDMVNDLHTQAKRHMANLKREIEDHKEINTETQQHVATLQETIQALTEEKEIIAREHAQAMDENEQVDTENKRVAGVYEDLAKEYHGVVLEHQKLVKESRRVAKKYRQLLGENAEAQSTITSLKNDLTQQDDMFTEKVTMMDKDLEDFKKESRGVRGRRRIPSDDADATMRPAQEPLEALNDVIRRDEAEMARLKTGLKDLQEQYCQHNPAMGKRARIGLGIQIQDLIRSIEDKADSIYQLYDVKEGLL